jgi:hypothetical protein
VNNSLIRFVSDGPFGPKTLQLTRPQGDMTVAAHPLAARYAWTLLQSAPASLRQLAGSKSLLPFLGADVMPGIAFPRSCECYRGSLGPRFTVNDFATLAAAVPSSARAIVLNSSYFCRVTPTWLPPRFSNVWECSDWTVAGENVAGFCAHPSAILLRYATPAIAKPGLEVIDRAPVILPGLALLGELGLHVNTKTRELRAVFTILIGAAVGDASALKLLSSVS